MIIAQKTKEPLLSRMSVRGSITFESTTPSNEEVRKAIASQVKSEEKLIVVRRIGTSFGRKHATFDACVYDDEKSLSSIEPSKKKKGDAAKPEAPAEKK